MNVEEMIVMGKRGPKKGQGGRPRGSVGGYWGKSNPILREYWRDVKRRQRLVDRRLAEIGGAKKRRRRKR